MNNLNLHHMRPIFRATATVLLTLSLSAFPTAFSHSATAQTAKTGIPSPNADSKGGQKEGIKVHGHWTIEVRNPDGKLVTHREFENALNVSGAQIIARLLAREKSAGLWRIQLTAVGLGVVPMVVEQNDPATIEVSRTLTLSVPIGSAPNANNLVLKGTTTVPQTWPVGGMIGDVYTLFAPCQPNILPSSCVNNNQFEFMTGTNLPQPPQGGSCPANTKCAVSVVAGQIIQVEVVISFS